MLKEKVYQMFIVGTGANLDKAISSGAGGVIFFTPDIKTKTQFSQLISDIKENYSRSKNVTPFLSIDQEGGRVERTENIRQKRFLSPMYAYKKGVDFLAGQTSDMLSELSEYGINMNFAPCLDVNTNPNNPIIGERAFSDNPKDVCVGFDTVYPIYKSKNIIPVIKHFPGHGDTNKDSHKELPTVVGSLSELESTHIYPFRHAIEQWAECVMVAHLHCICFDEVETPTSLSRNCIDYLRNNLKFTGVTISDDMYMKGLQKYTMTEACVLAIKSGINMFIYRDSSDDTINVIEDVIRLAENDEDLRANIENSYDKIIELKTKYGLI